MLLKFSEPDTPEPLKEYEPAAEVTEEAIEKSNEKKIEAIGAYQEGDLEKAFNLYSEAIEVNPSKFLCFSFQLFFWPKRF